MTPAHHLLESVVRPAPIGLRFRDVATGLPVRGGLHVTVTELIEQPGSPPPEPKPGRSVTLDSTGSNVWFAPLLPGLSAAKLRETADWSTLVRRYRIEATDPLGRFLPLRLDMDLPVRGLIEWPDWGTLPQAPLAALAETDTAKSPPLTRISPDALPLFSSAGRTAPAPLAEVRAQIAYRDTGAPAAWALLTASHGGRVRGIGQADDKGRVVLFFAHPERPRPSLATSPPAITDFRWSLDLTAYSRGLPSGEVPEFGTVMRQLTRPRDLFAETAAPAVALPSQLLSFGRPLTLKTDKSPATPDNPDGRTSLLMMQPA